MDMCMSVILPHSTSRWQLCTLLRSAAFMQSVFRTCETLAVNFQGYTLSDKRVCINAALYPEMSGST